MKYLFEHWRKIERVLAKGQPVLFLDFDGTLSPIAPTPQEALLPPAIKAKLKELSRRLQGRVAIVSGRSLKNLKRKVGLKGLMYVGNHGLEIEGPQLHYKVSAAGLAEKPLRLIKKMIRQEMRNIEGVFLEDKGLTLSFHYRNVRPKNAALVLRTFKGIVRPYILEKKIKLNQGKKVFEIKPPIDWHKGRAVVWLMRRLGKGKKLIAIYIGDDTTDEDAFAALKGRGISIAVGHRQRSQATYFLKSQREVGRFLQKFTAIN